MLRIITRTTPIHHALHVYAHPKHMNSTRCATIAASIHAVPTTDDREQPQNTNKEKTVTTVKTVPPPPKWSFHKRVLPPNLTALNSTEGKQLFAESLSAGNLEAYFPLSEQFLTQSDPAYCGVATLAMVLNALSIDPNVRWKGGWRWFNEDVLLSSGQQCCMTQDYVLRYGITMDEFVQMARCFGARVDIRRPACDTGNSITNLASLKKVPAEYSIESFRNEVQQLTFTQSDNNNNRNKHAFLVASFCRAKLNQTGEDGHFSPIAGYHARTDQVLILDVARFKYAPYWVPIETLFEAMQAKDLTVDRKRGWLIVRASMPDLVEKSSEKARPGDLVFERREVCPVGGIKVAYCPVVLEGREC